MSRKCPAGCRKTSCSCLLCGDLYMVPLLPTFRVLVMHQFDESWLADNCSRSLFSFHYVLLVYWNQRTIWWKNLWKYNKLISNLKFPAWWLTIFVTGFISIVKDLIFERLTTNCKLIQLLLYINFIIYN